MMDDLRLAAVAARVVAWHNRHPLARRISIAHVHAVGYVGLPFVGGSGVAAPMPATAAPSAGDGAEVIDLGALESGAGEAGSLRERALARARQQAGAAAGAAASTVAPSAPASAGGVAGGGAASGADAPLPATATLQPDFSENFIDPLRPREVARFATRAGQVLARPPADGPVREVLADGAHPGRLPARVYLLTAVVETDTRKSRVLLGTGFAAPVLGRRILDTPRVAALAGLAGLAVGVPAWLLQPVDDAPAPAAQVMAAAAPAAAAAASETVPPLAAAAADAAALPGQTAAASGAAAHGDAVGAQGDAGHGATATATASAAPEAAVPAHAASAAVTAAAIHATAAHTTAAPSPAAPASAPTAAAARHAAAGAAHGLPERVTVDLPSLARSHGPAAPSIRPVISEEDKARARQAREALVGQRPRAVAAADAPPQPALASPQAAAPATPAPSPAPAPAPAPAPGPATTARAAPAPAQARPQAPQASPAPAAAPASPSAAFALSTRVLRTRAEAEQVQVAMRSLLRTVGAVDVKVDVLPQGDDWRVVALPFSQRVAADKARALLVSRGMRVVVLDF